MTRSLRPLALASALAAVAALASPARANPKKLPFTYGATTMPPGRFELEQYVDIIPVQAARELPDGTIEGVWSNRFGLQTELEYGLTDRVEIAFYLAWQQDATADEPSLVFDGIKQRARIRISDPATWPIQLAGYVEVAELHDELELEQKLIASWRTGRFELTANLWIEQEYGLAEGAWELLYNPTAGATWQASPFATVGLEYWARGNFEADEPGSTVLHYAGPTVMLQGGEYWLAAGAYVRLDTSDVAVGDPYGRLFVRAIIGIGL